MPSPWIATCHVGTSKAGAALSAELSDEAGVAEASQPAFSVLNRDGAVLVYAPDMPDAHRGAVWVKEGPAYLVGIPVEPPQEVSVSVDAGEVGAAVFSHLFPNGLSFEDMVRAIAGMAGGSIVETAGGAASSIRELGDDSKEVLASANTPSGRTVTLGADL